MQGGRGDLGRGDAGTLKGAGELTDLPEWQRAFILRPNVRFTRTPENAIPRKGTEGESDVAAEMSVEASAPAMIGPQIGAKAPAVPAQVPAENGPQETASTAVPPVEQPVVWQGDAMSLLAKLRREVAGTLRHREAADALGLTPRPESPVKLVETPAAVETQPMITIAAPDSPVTGWVAPQMHGLTSPASTPGEASPAAKVEPALSASPSVNALPDSIFWAAMAEDVDLTLFAGFESGMAVDGVAYQAPIQPAPVAAASKAFPVAPAPVVAAPVPPLAAAPATAAPRFGAWPKPARSMPPIETLYRAIDLRRPSAALSALEAALSAAAAHLSAPADLIPAVDAEPASESVAPDVAADIAAEAPPVTIEAQAPVVEAEPAAAPVATRTRTRTVSARPLTMMPAPLSSGGEYEMPSLDLLNDAPERETMTMTQEALEQSAGLLESVLEDFGVRGEIIDVRPGPVVTLYEFEPAPGVKSSRVIGLSDDIARSMSALSARVAVVPGRNVIGIELPNPVRETVYFRELVESAAYSESRARLALCLGKTIGGEPVIAELAKMPHLLVAGTTGSGKSVAINTMILSLLYRLKPEECRLIMVDPKMLELSIYDGIPHLLTPVVTDPKKAVMALKWAVREMEERYRKMSRLGVRNIDGYNQRTANARARNETILASVQTGFDRSTGEPVFEEQELDLSPLPYIVVIVDEMADLMMVAGKEIEGAIQRLAQMARAAGIHLIMATQRPSVDVITGTIKANFPTRISFQVTSKIDSRTILGEQGAEHLLGQGDMLHMMGGGRISRVHGPFVSDEEVERVVAHLKLQGRPDYLSTVTEEEDEAEVEEVEDTAVFDKGAMGEGDADDLYEKAVKLVLRDRKCSTSYIQRRLQIGYNRAASLVERMEQEGMVGPANHVGKRSIIGLEREAPAAMEMDAED
ncbi:DNA translocase FtsK [Rhizobium sp. RU20A]|uniref:DNA translocase FtsK n=1 Tax=Rhizobium sp. RU20A TaxID=1907412 RepID=UPI00122C40BB|nr:DNA translocase FtsK [Rhizobium sp. RU20A]